MSARRRNLKQASQADHDRKRLASLAPALAASGRRKRITLALAIFLICAAAAFVAQWVSRHRSGSVLESLRLDGIDPIVAAAVEEAQGAVREAPKSGAAWGKLGQILYVHGLDRQAAECLARAMDFSPDDPRWPYLRGRAVKRENGDAALPFLRRAAELCRGDPPAPALLLVELLVERGRLAEAQTHLKIVLERHPDDARALLDRARMEIAQGRWQEACRDLEESTKRAPDTKVAHLLLANVYGRLGRAAAAAREADVSRPLSDQPNWPDPFVEEIAPLALGRSALLERAQMLLGKGLTKQAIVALEAAAAQYAGNAEVWSTLGDAYRRDGQLSQSETAFRRAVAARPDSSEAQLRLGATLCAERRFGDALTPLKEAVRLNLNLPQTHYQLGLCLWQLGEADGAIDAFREAARVEPSFRPAYIACGTALKASGRLAEAAVQLRRALELDADDAATAAMLKQVEAALKNPASKPGI